ncbi:MAG TPA: diguanylate cyclase [Patescibacteria group bacterium]|nr:diguanylate cyclase [Patescibacteria group bacterium]
MSLLARMRIAARLHMIVSAMIVALTLVIAGGGLALWQSQIEARRDQTRDVVQSAVSLAKEQFRRVQAGEIDEAHAKQQALAALAAMRYGDDNYFWVIDPDSRMIMHATRPDLNGRDLTAYRDADGVALFAEFARVARESGSGFVRYQWPKPGHEAPVAKLSYVELFAPWGWVIGSGTYADSLETLLHRAAFRWAALFLAGSVATAGAAWMLSRRLSGPLGAISHRMVRLSNGDRSQEIPGLSRLDEIGQMARALQVFQRQAEQLDLLVSDDAATADHAAQARRIDEARVTALLNAVGDGVYAIDRQGLCTLCSPSAARMLGQPSADAVVGQDMHALAHHSHADGSPLAAADSWVLRALDGLPEVMNDAVMWRADGSSFPAECRACPILSDGAVIGVVVAFRDVSEHRKVEEAARMANAVFNTTSEAILVTDSANRIKAVNPAFTRITGYGIDEVAGRNPKMLESGRHEAEFFHAMWASLNDGDFWQGEIWNRRKNGEVYPEWLSITPIRDHNDAVADYVAVFTDLAQRKRDDDRSRHAANFDALTELPNRKHFLDGVTQALSRAQGSNKSAALLYLDLDRFSAVNDSLGHAVGDRLLQMTAKRLRHAVRETDTVGRLGADEFGVLLEDLTSQDDTITVSQKIIDTLGQPFRIDDHAASVGVSIGIASFPTDAFDATALLGKADIAMYKAKETGRNNYRFYGG